MAYDRRSYEEWARRHPEAARELDRALEQANEEFRRMNEYIDESIENIRGVYRELAKWEAGSSRLTEFMLKDVDLQEVIREQLGWQVNSYKDILDILSRMPLEERMRAEARILKIYQDLQDAMRGGEIDRIRTAWKEWMETVRQEMPGLAVWAQRPFKGVTDVIRTVKDEAGKLRFETVTWKMPIDGDKVIEVAKRAYKEGGGYWEKLWKAFVANMLNIERDVAYFAPKFESGLDAMIERIKSAQHPFYKAVAALMGQFEKPVVKRVKGLGTVIREGLSKATPETQPWEDYAEIWNEIDEAISKADKSLKKAAEMKFTYPKEEAREFMQRMSELARMPEIQTMARQWTQLSRRGRDLNKAYMAGKLGFEEYSKAVKEVNEKMSNLEQRFYRFGVYPQHIGYLLRALKQQYKTLGGLMDETSEKVQAQKRGIEALNRTGRKVVKGEEEQEEASGGLGKTLDWLGSRFQRLGFRIGFYGWILSYAGRATLNLYKQIWNTLSRVIKAGSDWVRTLGELATAEALLEAAGLDLANANAVISEAQDLLSEKGLQLQAVWQTILALISAIAVMFGVELLPYLEDFAEGLASIAAREDFKQFLASVAEFIGTQFLPALLKVIDGFVKWWPTIEPVAAAFMKLLTAIAPVLPLVSMLGSALWLLGPVFTAVGTGLKILSFLFGSSLAGAVKTAGGFLPWLGSKFLGVKTAISQAGGVLPWLKNLLFGINPVILLIVYALIGLAAWWKELTALWNQMVGPAVGRLMKAFGKLCDALGVSVDWLNIVKAATFPVYLVFSGLIILISKIIDGIAMLIDWLADLEKKFHWIRNTVQAVNNTFGGFVGALSNAVNGVANFLSHVCIPHTMADIAEKTLEATRSIQTFRSELDRTGSAIDRFTGTPTPTFGGATQYITISAPITIESISSEMDLDVVTDAVTEAMSDVLRRVIR